LCPLLCTTALCGADAALPAAPTPASDAGQNCAGAAGSSRAASTTTEGWAARAPSEAAAGLTARTPFTFASCGGGTGLLEEGLTRGSSGGVGLGRKSLARCELGGSGEPAQQLPRTHAALLQAGAPRPPTVEQRLLCSGRGDSSRPSFRGSLVLVSLTGREGVGLDRLS
jgi:hypothetical protein